MLHGESSAPAGVLLSIDASLASKIELSIFAVRRGVAAVSALWEAGELCCNRLGWMLMREGKLQSALDMDDDHYSEENRFWRGSGRRAGQADTTKNLTVPEEEIYERMIGIRNSGKWLMGRAREEAG